MWGCSKSALSASLMDEAACPLSRAEWVRAVECDAYKPWRAGPVNKCSALEAGMCTFIGQTIGTVERNL